MGEHDAKDDTAGHGESGSVNENNNKNVSGQKEKTTGSKNKKKTRGKEKHMPFIDHLEELRQRLFKCIGAVIVLGIISYIFSEDLLNILTMPLERLKELNPGLQEVKLQILTVTGGFLIKIKVAFFAGVIFSIPVLIYQFWQFVSPGLFPKERKYVFPIIFFTILCFVIGTSFAYFVVIRLGLNFLLNMTPESMVANWTTDNYISFITMLMIVFGVVFELPMVALFLGRIGIINHKMMLKYWRHALICAIVFGAVLTPPDFITQLALAIPLFFLYGVSIFLVRMFGKKPSENDI